MATPKGKKGPKARPKRPTPVPRLRLDDSAARYARLLADPCNGDLVNAPFGDGYGGMVARFENEYNVGIQPTETAAAIFFNPTSGAVSISNTLLVDGTSIITPVTLPATALPGRNFLDANASQFRALAACMQIYWPGSELARQGMVSLGRFPAEVQDDTGLFVSRLRTASNYSKRMPDDCFEIIWRPSEVDMIPRQTTGGVGVVNGGTCLVGTASGLPPGIGIRVRIVVVYEWMPDPLSGFKTTVVKPTQPTTLATVLSRLDATGDWMAGTAHRAGRAISSLYHGVGSIVNVTNGARRMGAAMLGM